MADVIVVGAGHNGLVSACYLARAGLDVEVVEANEEIGGCTTTGPLVAGAPDHLLNHCAADIITMRSSTVVGDLDLARHGFRQVDIDPSYVMLSPDGSSLAFWRDPTRTAEEIRRFSVRDARAFLELIELGERVMDVALPMMATSPTRPDPAALRQSVAAAVRRPKELLQAAGLVRQSAAEAITARFEQPIVQAMVAVITNFGAPVTGPGTAVNMLMLSLITRFGMGRPVGGMGSLPGALARSLLESGGRIRTGSPVAQVIVHDGQVRGVLLDDGREIRARTVLAATEPHRALGRLLAPGMLSERQSARVEAIPAGNDGCTHFKVEMALSGRLTLSRHERWRGDGLDLRRPSAMVGSLEEICRAIEDAKHDRVPDPLPFIGMLPTAADPSQAPAGQDTLSLWSGWAPHNPEGGWAAAKDSFARDFVDHAGHYYEGIEALEIGRAVETPEEISERTGVRDGNVYHVDVSLGRLGPLRPARGFGGYRTPVPGYYITGAGTHPGPSVSGIPGQQAARTVLRDLHIRPGGTENPLPEPAVATASARTLEVVG
jgi:phytoene dehydrogenase-like protein